jgi:hypothetical protein
MEPDRRFSCGVNQKKQMFFWHNVNGKTFFLAKAIGMPLSVDNNNWMWIRDQL